MTRDPEKYLYDILDSCQYLVEFCRNQTIERYLEDRSFRGSVERELQTIGEAMLQLRNIAPNLAEQFTDCSQIIGFRHILVHGYFALDPKLVWDVVEHKLAELLQEVELLMRSDRDKAGGTAPGTEQ